MIGIRNSEFGNRKLGLWECLLRTVRASCQLVPAHHSIIRPSSCTPTSGTYTDFLTMAAQLASNSAPSAGRGNAVTPANQLANIAKLLGSHVTFTVGDKQTRTLSGKLWAYDPSLGVVGLECESTGLPPHLSSAPAAAASVAQASQTSRNKFAQPIAAVGFTIVKVSEIKKIGLHQSTQASNGTSSRSGADSLTPIHPVSLKAAQSREADAVKQSLTKVARTGKDVSQLGQQIFDALSKT